MPSFTERKRKAGCKARTRGSIAETLAVVWLWLTGYRIRARRFKTALGEVDIVVQRAGVTIGIEVKKRASLVLAVESITPRVRQRLQRALACYVGQQKIPDGSDMRVDAFCFGAWYRFRHVKNLSLG